MIPKSSPAVDSRSVDALLAEFQNRRHGYLPRWNPAPRSAGAAIGPILAHLIAAVLQRLNQVPAKDKVAMLDLLGLRLVPAAAAGSRANRFQPHPRLIGHFGSRKARRSRRLRPSAARSKSSSRPSRMPPWLPPSSRK